MAAGLISEEHFQRCAIDLWKKSTRKQDGWELKQHEGKTYLYKKVVKQLGYTSPNDEIGADTEELIEETDSACMAVKGDNSSPTLTFEYHVVYSESYSVPVLYFNVYKADGGLLPLDDVWHLVPPYYQDRLRQDRWTFLSQQEHPYFGRPFYHLHQCHTEALMSHVVTIDQSETSNYVIGWLSAVGPVVHLTMPLEYGQLDQ